MRQSVYIDQIERLKNQFGEKAYADERVQAIWSAVKNYDESIFTVAITEVIANHAHAPLKNKIQEAYNEIKSKTHGANKKFDCPYCNGGGFIPDDKPLPNVYRCRCDMGNSMPSYVAQWQGLLVRIVPTQAELNWRNVVAVVSETFNKK